jgi:glycosyltransferase involved in cell wall biosynthesis
MMNGMVRKLMREYFRLDQLDNPRISVIVPVYNEVKHIRETLEAIKNQVYANIELIVVDNGSTDGTGEIAREYTSKVIREERQGISIARNRGAAEATGNIIVFVDADTIVPEGMAEGIVDSVNRGYSCGHAGLKPDEDVGGAGSYFGAGNLYKSIMTPSANLFGFNPQAGAGALMYFRRDDLEEVANMYGYVFDESQKTREDVALFGRMQKNGYWADFMGDMKAETSARRIKEEGIIGTLVSKFARDLKPHVSDDGLLNKIIGSMEKNYHKKGTKTRRKGSKDQMEDSEYYGASMGGPALEGGMA